MPPFSRSRAPSKRAASWAQTTAQLTSRIVAEVRELSVQPGDRVTRGQIVAQLDDRDLAARRAQAQASVLAAQSGRASAEADGESAEARLILARANHQRMEQLREKNSATPQELDRATAELRMAEAESVRHGPGGRGVCIRRGRGGRESRRRGRRLLLDNHGALRWHRHEQAHRTREYGISRASSPDDRNDRRLQARAADRRRAREIFCIPATPWPWISMALRKGDR